MATERLGGYALDHSGASLFRIRIANGERIVGVRPLPSHRSNAEHPVRRPPGRWVMG
jgi:hypothetical protein